MLPEVVLVLEVSVVEVEAPLLAVAAPPPSPAPLRRASHMQCEWPPHAQGGPPVVTLVLAAMEEARLLAMRHLEAAPGGPAHYPLAQCTPPEQ